MALLALIVNVGVIVMQALTVRLQGARPLSIFGLIVASFTVGVVLARYLELRRKLKKE